MAMWDTKLRKMAEMGAKMSARRAALGTEHASNRQFQGVNRNCAYAIKTEPTHGSDGGAMGAKFFC